MAIAIVTGANVGLGFETARGLLGSGFQVVLTSREDRKAEEALDRLRVEFPKAKVAAIDLDLAKAASVDEFASKFATRFGQWDVLVNNAGAKVLKDFSQTDSNIEYHFGVNAVGHFAITADLMPHRSSNARVISVSSIVARFAPSTLGPSGSVKSYSPGQSYAASKLANLMFALELSNRSVDSDLVSVAAHPGFARAEPYGPKSTRFFESFLAQSAESGARPQIKAAVDVTIKSGSYLGPKYLELWGKSSRAKIPALCSAENLRTNWEILESLSGRKLTL